MIATDVCHHGTNEMPKRLICVTRVMYIKACDGSCANLFASYRNYMSVFTTVAINSQDDTCTAHHRKLDTVLSFACNGGSRVPRGRNEVEARSIIFHVPVHGRVACKILFAV